jgi:hypothetical protein
MLEIYKATKPIDLDESDVIPLAEAARLSGRRLPSLAVMLDRGSLPWYEYPPHMPGKGGQRYTSRKAVLALPKEKTRGVSARKPAKR